MFSNLHLEPVFTQPSQKLTPVKQAGKAVAVNCWYSVIFNPHSAALKDKDGSPRLLAAAPIILKKDEQPKGAKNAWVIWATLSLDEQGRVQNFIFADPVNEVFRPQVGGSLQRWRFAPARHDGKPVAAELSMPLILNKPHALEGPGTPPKVLTRKQPKYPFVMRKSGLRGEVLLEFVVDETGAVVNPMVIQSNNPGFDDAAIDAILKWKFAPSLKDGKPARARMQLPMIFGLNGGGRDYYSVEKSPDEKQATIPAQLRYDIGPILKGVLTPVYPYVLAAEKAEGKAVVVFMIDEEGGVAGTNVIEASKPEFGLALVAAVEAFGFIPAMKDGKPTKSVLRVEQEFVYDEFGPIMADEDRDMLKLEKKHPERILSAKKLDALPKPISQRSAVFPSSLQNKVERGQATIQIIIDEEGKVRLPRIAEATDPAFGYAAIQAVSNWRFEPPKAGGRAVVTRVQVPFEFKHESPSDKPAPASAK